ncbi:MAG: DUF4230 domain-containing protein [Chitinophagales bacterium]|nr:DUF4230 domain-containing protein [Chitinophagales bacterium]
MVFLKGFFVGLLVMGVLFFMYKKFMSKNTDVEIEATTIMKSVESISKLMVLEGNFTETYTYQERSKVFFDLIPQEKKAIVILDAKVIVGYDLKKMVIFVDKENKRVVIEKLPDEEVNIIPDLKFYDIQASTFTSFTKDDINKVQADAKQKIEQQIENSSLKIQARQRLIENLGSLVNVSKAIGWTVEDKTNSILDEIPNISSH